MDRTIKIIEQGNGLNLSHGDTVYDARAGELLRLTSEPGSIQTDDSRGNYRVATAETAERDVTDYTDEEMARLPSVLIADVEPAIAVGARVSGGKIGTEDHDTGKVIESSGDRVMVAWDSGVTTPADADSLTAE